MSGNDTKTNGAIIGVIRQTSLILIPPSLLTILLIYLPWQFLAKYDLVGQFQTILFLWNGIVCLYLLRKFSLWLSNRYILKEKIIIILASQGLFHKQSTEILFEKIANITLEKKGVFSHIFDFGNIIFSINGLAEPIILNKVRGPEELKEEILKICKA